MLERINRTRIILPMKMHYGVPAIPAVKAGDAVKSDNVSEFRRREVSPFLFIPEYPEESAKFRKNKAA